MTIKGPWTAKPEVEGMDWSVWDDEGRIAYAIDEEHAHFIAASPDMLRALEALESCTLQGCERCRGLLDEALKKARGG